MTLFTSTTQIPRRRDRINFAEITAPLDVDTFLSTFWTREAVHLSEDGRTFDDQFGWDGVNTILNMGGLTFPRVKVSRNDHVVPSDEFTIDEGGQRAVDPRAVLRLFQQGASFGISGADAYWAPLRSVVDSVHDALLESVHANVYCSPPNTQGFQCHYDLHEVFVLQVEGTKHWRVFRPTSESPLHGWQPDEAPAASTEPYVDVVLRKGDVLYIPRGHWHYAVAQDSISLHVTVGVTCRKGTAFLDWLAGDLQQQPSWRRNAPLLSGATRGGTLTLPSGFHEWADDLKRSLMDKLAEPDLFERFSRDIVTGTRPRHTANLPILLPSGPVPLERLVFERPAGRRHITVDAGESGISVTASGCDIQLEGVSPALINRILESESFTVADVLRWDPEAVPDEISELLVEFVKSGLVYVRPLTTSVVSVLSPLVNGSERENRENRESREE